MATVKEFNEYGTILENWLPFRTSPLAVKMLESEADIPEEAYRPYRDDGIHYAQCQAFALSRRDKKTVAMLKEDNWCPAPINAYGLDERPERPDMVAGQAMGYHCFEPGRYIGIITAPLKNAAYVPDMVLMYPTTNQLRGLLMTIPPEDMENIRTHLFAPSCTYAVVNPIQSGQYWVVLPDPGETTRALAEDGEMMLSIPAHKMAGVMANVRQMPNKMVRFWFDSKYMLNDFPQPQHYIDAFKMWGMDYDKSGRSWM